MPSSVSSNDQQQESTAAFACAFRRWVYTSRLQRWDQRVWEGRAVEACVDAAQRDVGFECEA
eukprot:9475134-Pyramimonas_sp.AAC.1